MTRIVLTRHRNMDAFDSPNTEKVAVDRPIDAARLASIATATLWAPHADPFERLPEILASMPALESLTIAGSSVTIEAVADLAEGVLPPALRELRLYADFSTVLRWPKFVLPNLRSLYVSGEFRWDNAVFPQLETLAFRPDRPLRTLRQALELPLTSLNLHVVPAADIFPILAARPLEYLGLYGGTKLTNLAGIEALPDLTGLMVKNQRNMTDLSGLRDLPRLEDLNLQYCSKITNIEVINDIRALRRLTLVGCGDVGLEKIAFTLARLEQQTVGATT